MLKTALCSELNGDEWKESDVPEWVEIFPPGPDIKGVDGRMWRLSDPQQIVKAFNRNALTMVVDYEHSTELKGKKGEPAPATGWINELEVRPDSSVLGKVEWTVAAIEAIKNKEYRYLSPVFLHTKEDSSILKLDSLGLTNKPNLVMKALNHQSPVSNIDDFSSDEWQQVAKALNIESINSSNDILQALNHQKIEQANGKYIGAVNSLIDDGYIAPCEKNFYLAACRASGYDDAIKSIKFIRTTKPPFAHLKEQLIKGNPRKKKNNLTDSQRAVCREMGINEEHYSKFVKGE